MSEPLVVPSTLSRVATVVAGVLALVTSPAYLAAFDGPWRFTALFAALGAGVLFSGAHRQGVRMTANALELNTIVSRTVVPFSEITSIRTDTSGGAFCVSGEGFSYVLFVRVSESGDKEGPRMRALARLARDHDFELIVETEPMAFAKAAKDASHAGFNVPGVLYTLTRPIVLATVAVFALFYAGM